MKVIFSFFIFLSSMGFSVEPYDSITEIPFDCHGWFVNWFPIIDICVKNEPKVAIEIGSWAGLSTRFIAQHMPEGSKLYAVDTWLGSNCGLENSDSRIPYIYHLFLSNIKKAGLSNKIIPIRMKSLEAANALSVMADLIYIDGDLDTKSVYDDIISWNAHLNHDGIICGSSWVFPSVKEGVNKAAIFLNKAIMAQDNFWRLQ